MRNLFIIISTRVTQNMYTRYSKAIDKNLVFISDKSPMINESNIYHYSNNAELIKKGFTGMHNKYNITAWDKAFYFISQHCNENNEYENYWIIEDDCYINDKEFSKLADSYNTNMSDLLCFGWKLKYTIKEHRTWVHWKRRYIDGKHSNKTYFDEIDTEGAITQLVRLSNDCVNEILKFKDKYNRFIFHELLFTSLANASKLTSELIRVNTIKLCAEEKNSIIYKKYPDKDNKYIISEFEKLNYVVVHPFKKWYDN